VGIFVGLDGVLGVVLLGVGDGLNSFIAVVCGFGGFARNKNLLKTDRGVFDAICPRPVVFKRFYLRGCCALWGGGPAKCCP
ncbi:hypothetical protein NL457_29355, partial [Klebsiella pneumoniae]|nr:hypothetical protein [Klebsiella pneumoniae]